jgi:hypothetical protein
MGEFTPGSYILVAQFQYKSNYYCCHLQPPLSLAKRTSYFGFNRCVYTNSKRHWMGSGFRGCLEVGWRQAQEKYYYSLGQARSGLRWTTVLILKLWQVAWNIWEHQNQIEHDNAAAQKQIDTDKDIEALHTRYQESEFQQGIDISESFSYQETEKVLRGN